MSEWNGIGVDVRTVDDNDNITKHRTEMLGSINYMNLTHLHLNETKHVKGLR